MLSSELGLDAHVCILSLAFLSFLSFLVWIGLQQVNLAHIPVMSGLIPPLPRPPWLPHVCLCGPSQHVHIMRVEQCTSWMRGPWCWHSSTLRAMPR